MKLNRSLIIAVGCLLVALTAFGQTTTGALSGTVTTGGSPLPGVTVTVTSPNIQGSQTAVSDGAGHYSFTALPPGDCAVTFELQGLQAVTKHVQVEVSQTARLDADLKATKPGELAVAEEVTVTGSLIPRPTLEAMSPVATMDVQELNYQGATRLENFLQTLPQVFAAQNSTVANGASGTATVDLRFMGASRTLVLLDGKRLPAGDRYAISPDLNFIPSALVKRVDILTGGASSTYGADAVAGVVNFVIDTDLEGLKAGIFGGGYQHNNNNSLAETINQKRGFAAPTGNAFDGGQFESYAAWGGKFGDKGHATLYVDYRKTAALLKNRRDYTNCSVTALRLSGPRCSGSSTIPTGRFITDGGQFTLDTSGSGNTFRDWSSTNDLFNFAVYNYMQRPDERWGGGAFLNYDWNKHAQGYASIMLMDDTTNAQIAPSGDFFVTDHINCNNPMLSADQVKKICTDNGYGPTDDATLIVGRRNVEGGPRADLLNHQAYRMVTGIKGDINDTWRYDVYGLHGQTRVPEQYLNDLNSLHLQEALLVVGDRNDPSTWRCRSDSAVAEGCVPWNIFKVNGVTKGALTYLSLPLLSNTSLLTEVAALTFSGDLKNYGLVLPTAAQGLSVAFGADYNRFELKFVPDAAYRSGIGAGQGGPIPAIDGSYDTKEVYAELLAPLIQGMRGAEDLSVELGYRSSDYSTSGRFPTYKAQLSYAPVKDFKVRGGYNRATRSPNMVELFRPQGITLGGTQDICSSETPSATLEQCRRTGVTDAQYGHILDNPAEQYNTLAGGNIDLKPEIADTTTFGIVLTPQAIPALSATFDYYNIKLKDRIGTLGADQIISACADTGNPTLCSLIHRDARGTLWLTPDGYTRTTNLNIGQLRAEGIDANLDYSKSIGRSSLTFALIGSYMLKNFTDTGLYAYDCAGLFGDQCASDSTVQGGIYPKWRHLSRLGWQIGSVGVTLGWRMVGSATVDASSNQTGLYDPGSIPAYKANNSYHYSPAHYFDLATTYNLSNMAGLTIGVNNIADKEPPMGAGFSAVDYGPGWYGTYDPYGRYVHASLTFNLK